MFNVKALAVAILVLVGCDASEVPEPDAYQCGVSDHLCCDNDAGGEPCEPGLRCENERGKGVWRCNPDVPPGEGDPPPEQN